MTVLDESPERHDASRRLTALLRQKSVAGIGYAAGGVEVDARSSS
jgi:hypothetical protein